jgi:hypothetical protein
MLKMFEEIHNIFILYFYYIYFSGTRETRFRLLKTVMFSKDSEVEI